jgi:hypothetical protein
MPEPENESRLRDGRARELSLDSGPFGAMRGEFELPEGRD